MSRSAFAAANLASVTLLSMPWTCQYSTLLGVRYILSGGALTALLDHCWPVFLWNVMKFEIVGVDLSKGEWEIVQDGGVFKITEFEIAHSKWLKRKKNKGKSKGNPILFEVVGRDNRVQHSGVQLHDSTHMGTYIAYSNRWKMIILPILTAEMKAWQKSILLRPHQTTPCQTHRSHDFIPHWYHSVSTGTEKWWVLWLLLFSQESKYKMCKCSPSTCCSGLDAVTQCRKCAQDTVALANKMSPAIVKLESDFTHRAPNWEKIQVHLSPINDCLVAVLWLPRKS